MQSSICLQSCKCGQSTSSLPAASSAGLLSQWLNAFSNETSHAAAHSTSSLLGLLCPSLLPRLLLAGGGRGGRANSEPAPAAMAATLAAAAANADAPVCISTSFMTAPTDLCQQTCCICICQSRGEICDLAVFQLYLG